ncbi:hypothetical protein P4O66_015260 [Electrophorus voltai]|uniref:EF-hand domain-containing protein n=1 Tax=Electrophorus voltai TaxID=2609070 RepID=A0AAD9DRQ9_9TELE|nr:hypothetical protein P4O66_015260 [Electrophorus voltai]
MEAVMCWGARGMLNSEGVVSDVSDVLGRRGMLDSEGVVSDVSDVGMLDSEGVVSDVSDGVSWKAAVCEGHLAIVHISKVVADKVDDDLEMTVVCHRPEGLEQLEAQTNFNKRELQVLYRGFKNECPSGVVNEETFKQIYSQFFPHGGMSKSVVQKTVDLRLCVCCVCVHVRVCVCVCVCVHPLSVFLVDASAYAHYLFNAFDSGHSGSIKFEDFVTALSILLRGSTREKLQWTFNLYDINKDGYINKEGAVYVGLTPYSTVQEMTDIVSAIYDMMGKYTYPALKTDTPKQHVEAFFQKMDKNRDGVVTLDEFILSCQEDDNIMRSLQLFENVM